LILWQPSLSVTVRGFTLLEVLLSLFLVSFIFLGIAAEEVYTLRQARTAYYYTIASLQLQNLSERLLCNSYDVDVALQAWNDENALTLPAGEGTIEQAATTLKITLKWGTKICDRNNPQASECLQTVLAIV
jgi:Tfp pilus assembly protein PilX